MDHLDLTNLKQDAERATIPISPILRHNLNNTFNLFSLTCFLADILVDLFCFCPVFKNDMSYKGGKPDLE